MAKKGNEGWAFGFGLLAGVFLGLYLSSDRGRELRHRTREKIGDFSEELGEMAQQKFGQIASEVETVVEKGQAMVDKMGKSVKKSLEQSSNAADDVIADVKTRFQKGVDKAKKRLEEDES